MPHPLIDHLKAQAALYGSAAAAIEAALAASEEATALRAQVAELETRLGAAGTEHAAALAAIAAADQAEDAAYEAAAATAQTEMARLRTRIADLEAAPATPAPVALPAEFRRMADFGTDWGLTYAWGNTALAIYLPNWAQGPLSIGDPSLVRRNDAGAVVIDARTIPARDGRTWATGSMQVNRPKAPLGRAGAVVHVTDPSAVAAFFGYGDNGKEVDFELTRQGGVVAWSPAVHMPRAAGGLAHSDRRVLRRAPFVPGRAQVLEYDLRSDRCDFYCDGALFETVRPADMSDTAAWDTRTGMAIILAVEKHEGWAGWDYRSGRAQMVVHGLLVPTAAA